ncbi:hypothetical protein ACFUJR_32560 [Streptomyces sp. NPDC057271]|uniref:hypothetical protein n=1 Tax=unclassified Streptomyces TaxID=2593676 RepID=UPI00363108E1
MIIVYSPDGEEPQHFDARTLRVSEVAIVCRTIDQKWPQIQQGLADEELDALRGVAWVIAKRSQPNLRFADFDPVYGELTTRLDRKEIEAFATGAVLVARAQKDATEESVRAIVESSVLPTAFDQEHAQHAIDKALAEDPKDDPAPDGPQSSGPTPASPSSETSTSGSSPTSSTSLPLESTTS